MSYDVYLVDPETRATLQAAEPHRIAGGTFEAGGTRTAWLNVTYNYAPILRRALGTDGIRKLYGLGATESVPVLLDAIGCLADDVTDDYWDATEGNVRRALLDLVELARMFPDGEWDGD